jgi:capsular polysaccharide transport system permease protein
MVKPLFDKIKSLDRLFLWCVALPTLLATVYYGLIASDIYVSQAHFVVRSPDKPSPSALGMVLKGVGFSNAGDETFAVREFINSRDALDQLNKDGLIERAYRDPSASLFDRFDPFGWNDNKEELFKFYQKNVAVSYDTTSSILTVQARGFNAKNTEVINRRLLDLSEQLVNRLNKRGQQDLVRYSRSEVDEAKAQAQLSSRLLAQFRNREGVVDPEKQAEAQLMMVAKLQDDLIATRNQLRQLVAFTPKNPQIPPLRVRVKGLESEIASSLKSLAGGNRSLAASAVEYQRLKLDSQIAEKQLAAAMASMTEAQNDARRKQAYVERIVEPNLPDAPLEPLRVRGIISILALGLVAWLVLRMLLAGVREHQD